MKLLLALCSTVSLIALLLCIPRSEQAHTGTAASVTLNDGADAVTVNIPDLGPVVGNYETTLWSNYTFMQFRGIPYAESPKGLRRFKLPVARSAWRQPLDATKYGRRCPVITTVSKLTKEERNEDLEDCLNLCVYTRNLAAKRPVMFYAYGGGFYNGSSSDHPPRHLLEQDVVLVVPNYRIGALGWLSTLSPDMPGNAPVFDLLLALEWVRNHIGAFGGDPEQITIFGQSAGTAMVGSLLLSPQTPRGYIKRAIVQSGSIFADWAINRKPFEQTERVCKALGCKNCKTPEEQYRCVAAADVLHLLEVTTSESFAPIVGDLHGMLPQHPAVLMIKYRRPIPLMTGFTKHDGSFALATYYDEMKKAVGNMNRITVRQFASGIMKLYNETTQMSNNLLTRLLFDRVLLESSNHKQALAAYFDLTNIIFMKSPVITLASHFAGKMLASTYLYSFDYEGEHTRFGYEFGNEHYPFEGGVHHSNDNIYVFSTHPLNDADTTMAKRVVELWTSFAITGVPSISGEPNIPAMTSKSGPYFRINTNITIGDDVLQELTATIDDPDKKKLDREHIEF